jgi:hypothetical protein
VRRTNALVSVALAVTFLLAGSAAFARPDSTAPYGDKVTGAIADKLDGKQRNGWLATSMDEDGYTGPRHAEIIKTSAGHGQRWMGVIHVPQRKVAAARHCFAGKWHAEHGRAFVLPLESEVDNFGDHTANFKKAAKWAAKTLGKKWKVRIS